MHSRLESFRTDSQCGSTGGYGSLCDVGHQGLLHDKEFGPAATGLVHNRARTLNPPLARFNQRDPIGYPDGMNGYEYARSRPTGFVDGSGMKTHTVSGKLGEASWENWAVSLSADALWGGTIEVSKKTREEDCCKGAIKIRGGRRTVKYTVAADLSVGLGGRISVGGWKAGLNWDGPGIKGTISFKGIEDSCIDSSCTVACGSVGITRFGPGSITIGKGVTWATLDLYTEGSIKACYAWGTQCKTDGLHAGFCGKVRIGIEYRLFWHRDSHYIDDLEKMPRLNGCIAFYGSSEVLGRQD
jgi:RHS repeat-associated protein